MIPGQLNGSGLWYPKLADNSQVQPIICTKQVTNIINGHHKYPLIYTYRSIMWVSGIWYIGWKFVVTDSCNDFRNQFRVLIPRACFGYRSMNRFLKTVIKVRFLDSIIILLPATRNRLTVLSY